MLSVGLCLVFFAAFCFFFFFFFFACQTKNIFVSCPFLSLPVLLSPCHSDVSVPALHVCPQHSLFTREEYSCLHFSNCACFINFKVDVAINSIQELEEKNMDFSFVSQTVLHGLFVSAESGTVKVGWTSLCMIEAQSFLSFVHKPIPFM